MDAILWIRFTGALVLAGLLGYGLAILRTNLAMEDSLNSGVETRWMDESGAVVELPELVFHDTYSVIYRPQAVETTILSVLAVAGLVCVFFPARLLRGRAD